MASGKIHKKVTITVSPIGGLFILFGYYNNIYNIYNNGYDIIIISLLLFIGSLVGLFMEPDLDIDHITESEKTMMRVFTPLGLLWIILWTPYAKLIPHRHPISHWPILGTVIRFVYILSIIGVPVMLIASIAGQDIWQIKLMANNLYPYLKWLMIGNIISDYAHFMMDNL